MSPDLILSHESHRHHLRLHMGIERTAQTIEWSDSMLAKMPDPPMPLIELSMAQGRWEKDLLVLLEPLMKHPREIEPLRPVFGEIARLLRAEQLKLHDVINALAHYGVHDSSGSQLLPRNMYDWLQNLVYECINIHYVYPSKALLSQGVRDIFFDLVGGLESLANAGTYHCAMRPAVRQAKTAKDAELKPAPHQTT